ncbi:MAG TPA: murein biosynthesis integral membrane protein MurJ [Candidatus Paceibacterota bacterium]
MVKRIFSIFTKEIIGLHEAAYLLALFAIFSQILALIRDKLLAYTFGAGHILDIYYAAFRIPDLIFASIASLVSASVLIPFFLDRIGKDSDGGNKFVDSIFSVFFLVIIITSAIVFIFAPSLIGIFIPGFVNDQMFHELVVSTRILLLSPIFLGLSNFFSSITQMYRRFLVYALSPLVYNIGIIIGVLFLYPIFGLYGLIYGVVLGAFMHMAIQIPFIMHKGIFPSLSIHIDWKAIKKVVLLSLPRTLTLSSNQISTFFLVALASFMIGGSISIFSLAYNLQSVPLSIIGVSYSSAIFPTLSKFFVEGEHKGFLDKMIESARHIIFWSIPITILFIVLRAQIVRTIYGAGQFDWSDTRLTAAALAVFILSVLGQSLILLFVRAYYAVGKTTKPLIVNIISALYIALLGYVFLKAFYNYPIFAYFLEDLLKISNQNGTSVIVLPMAYSIGIFLNTYLLWHMFERDYPGFTKPVIATLFQSFAASIIMGYITFLSLRFFNIFFTLDKALGVFLQGFCAGIVGIISWVIILNLLKSRELIEIYETLHHKFWKAKVVVPDQEGL